MCILIDIYIYSLFLLYIDQLCACYAALLVKPLVSNRALGNLIAEETAVDTPPPKQSAADVPHTPCKPSLQWPRLIGKTSAWLPVKPQPLPAGVVEQVENAAENAVALGQGNPRRVLHQTILACRVCKREKHSCAWETRANGEGTKCTGGSCLSCSKAARHLGISRSMQVLTDVPAAMDAVLVWSRYYAELKRSRGEDHCQCSDQICKARRTEK